MLNMKKLSTKIMNQLIDGLIPDIETVTTHITANTTNASITDARITRVGRIVFLFIVGKTKVATNAGSEYQMCTLDSSLLSTNGGRICNYTTGIGSIQESGVVTYRPTVTMSSGSNFYMNACYVLKNNWQS